MNRSINYWVQSQGWEDPLEMKMATHSSIPAGITPWTEEPGGLQTMGPQTVAYDQVTKPHTHTHTNMHSLMNRSQKKLVDRIK